MPQDRKDRREKMAKEAKTNAMRMLDRQKVKYEAFSYECDEFIDGIHSADKIGAPYDQSFKTLVMEGKSGGYFVFVVPIEKEVDRKAAAKAVGEKTVDMIHVKDITKSTTEKNLSMSLMLDTFMFILLSTWKPLFSLFLVFAIIITQINFKSNYLYFTNFSYIISLTLQYYQINSMPLTIILSDIYI